MTKTQREWLGLGVLALALVLGGVVYAWLPVTAPATDRFLVSVSLMAPLSTIGVLLSPSRTPLGRREARLLLLIGASITVQGAPRAARLYDVVLSPVQENVHLGLVLLLLCLTVWAWRPVRDSSPSANGSAH